MPQEERTDWSGILFSEVQFVSLRARGSDPSGCAMLVSYDRGAVVLTSDADSSNARSRVLDFDEIRGLLDVLRNQAQVTPRLKGIDSSALSAMVAALARIFHSPGPVPFAAARFGAIAEDGEGLVGEVVVQPGISTTLRARDGEIRLETRKDGASGKFDRRLTLDQLRAPIAALRTRTSSGHQLNDLWSKMLGAAQHSEATIQKAIAAADGNRR